MKTKPFLRILIITLTALFAGCLINSFTDMETRLGLDTLYRNRGEQKPPEDAVVVAMDETSDKYFNLGWDFKEWRKYHARLIEQLKKQQAALIVFDLQFIAEQPAYDQAFADALKSAGNVLVTACLRNNNETREQCSKNALHGKTNNSSVNSGKNKTTLWEKIPPNPLISSAVLDFAPFVLPDDVDNPVIREAWTFINNQTETPALPVLVWFYYLHQAGKLPEGIYPEFPLSEWMSRQRRICTEGLDTAKFAYTGKTGFELRIAQLFCSEDSHYLNFYGSPRKLRMESYSDVYQGKIGNLKNKVVFVGVAKQRGRLNKQDSFETPFTTTETGRMAGVEIMATEFSNLLEENFLKPLPPFPVQLAFGLVIVWIMVVFTGISGLLLSSLLATVYAFFVQWCFNRNGLWLPVAVPLLVQLPFSGFITLYWSYLDQKLKIKEITAENKRLIKDFIDEFKTSKIKSNVKVGLQKNQIKPVFGICLATDIKGYTTIAESNPADLVYANLEEYFELLCAPVSARGGEIANITGDSLMAIWRDLPDDKQRKLACLATLEMEEAVERFSKRSALGAFPTRIGLHQGRFALGNFLLNNPGSNPVGDIVNIASRIEGLNKKLGTKILASSAIVANTSGVVFRPVGDFQLLGRTELISLVEIVGLESNMTPELSIFYKRFANGLKLFQQGQWEQALLTFKRMLETHGGDGPAKYYFDKASVFRVNPPQKWEGFITLDSK